MRNEKLFKETQERDKLIDYQKRIDKLLNNDDGYMILIAQKNSSSGGYAVDCSLNGMNNMDLAALFNSIFSMTRKKDILSNGN